MPSFGLGLVEPLLQDTAARIVSSRDRGIWRMAKVRAPKLGGAQETRGSSAQALAK
jgi:hypothetical protein